MAKWLKGYVKHLGGVLTPGVFRYLSGPVLWSEYRHTTDAVLNNTPSQAVKLQINQILTLIENDLISRQAVADMKMTLSSLQARLVPAQRTEGQLFFHISELQPDPQFVTTIVLRVSPDGNIMGVERQFNSGEH